MLYLCLYKHFHEANKDFFSDSSYLMKLKSKNKMMKLDIMLDITEIKLGLLCIHNQLVRMLYCFKKCVSNEM